MGFKEHISGKILNKSNSFNYYKNYNGVLLKKIRDYDDELINLNKKIDEIQLKNQLLVNELIKNEEGFVFSVIIPVYNTQNYLKEALNSIINQDFPIDNVQIILVDDGSTDDSKEICMDYVEKYPGNIVYIYQKNQGQANARNNGLNFAKGTILNFLDSDDKLQKDTFNEIYKHFMLWGNEVDVISIPRYFFGKEKGGLALNRKYNPSRIVDIEKEFDFPMVSVSCSFIRRDALSDRFNPDLIISEDSLLINKIILEKGKFGVLDNVKYLYRKRDEVNSTIDTKKTKKEYFSLRMEIYFKELINYSIEKYGYVPKYIQTVLIYDLRWLFEQKTEIGVLTDDEKIEYYTHIFDVLQYIDDDLILSQEFDKSLRTHMIDFKNGNMNL